MDGNAIEEEASVQQPTQNLPPPNQENTAEAEQQSTPETAIPQGLPAAGPVIASGEEIISDEREQSEEGENKKTLVELEDEATMQLGDHYEIQMATGKKISGIIYFVDSEKLIRILPDGINHKLEDIPLVEITDPDTGETYTDIDPELKVTEIVLTQKGSITSFVDLIGLRIGQKLTTFKQDQTLGPILEVTAVNSEKDSIRVVQSDDTFEREIDFNHKGIPLDEEFVIMQIKQDELPQEDQVEVESAPIGILPEGAELEIEEIGEIVLPSRMQVQEISATERIYDERQQKNSFIEDLRTMLEVTAQNNPTVLKNIRVMTEVFSDLKNSILKRDDAGYPNGEKQSTIESINDLITLGNIPIARPVLDTKRILISEKEPNVVNPQFTAYTLTGIAESSESYLDRMGDIQADIDGVGMPRWYLVLSSYFKRFPMGDAYQNNGYSMQQDMEYFRHGAPASANESSTDGLQKIKPKFDDNGELIDYSEFNPSKVYGKGIVNMFIEKIPFSYRRGHGPVLRSLPRGGTEVVVQGDRATKSGTVLFPFEAALDGGIGATRTGNLWDLLQRSFASKTWMDKILETYNMPTSELNTRKIVHITNTNVDVIKTQFIEYLRDIMHHISLKGRGDLYKLNADLGIQDMELTTAQVGVVEEKVKTTIAGLRQYITNIRNELAKPAEKPKVAPFLNVEILEALSKVLQKEPLLEELVQEMNAKLPNYKDIDIAIFSYLLVYAQDYILAALTGNETYASRERARFERNKLLETLIANRKMRELEESKGHTPEVNPCRHVKDLNKIRKIKNESERLAILTQFLVQYDGGVDGNWIKCQRCKKHLICRHEVLQIQQFLHPNEQQIIQKQLVLGFAGGRQGDKYICRNCGQPMAELEFDTSLEYNDEGIPMMGRSVIVDKDALEKERIQGLLGIRLDTDEKMKFKNDTQKGLYTILRYIQTKIGVELDKRGISRILDMGEREVLSLMSEKEYLSSKRKIKYVDYKTRRTIAIVASLILIEIQTHIPNYQVRFVVEGCKPGFGGFPLEEKANPENEDESIGIQYITCILNQIHENDQPWKNGFQTISRDEERRATIKSQIVYYCTELAKDNTIQTMLRDKQEFERNIYGAAAAKGRPNEYIPNGFLPRQETFQEATENAANAPTVPEGAPRTNLGRLVLADTWIRAANRAIREKGEPVVTKYSPFIETACCLNPIKEPQKFWSTVSLPPAPPLTTLSNPFSQKSIAYTSFIPRPLQILQETAPDASAYYKVVLKLCYKGMHLGQPHEFGADNKCDWCDLEIPVDLQNPDIDTSGNILINWERVKSELDRQGIQVSEQIFQQILDKSHQLNTFEPYVQSKPLTPVQLYTFVKTIVPEPVPSFSASIDDAKTRLSGLNPTASKIDIVQAILPLTRGPIQEEQERGEYQLQEEKLKELLGNDFKYLEGILNESPESIFNILLSYFVVPAERLVKGKIDIVDYLVGIEQLKLGKSHETEIESMLTKHMGDLLNLERDVYGIRKLENYVTTMSKFLSMSHDLRASRLRSKFITMSLEGSVLFLNKVIRIFTISILANLIDPDIRAIDAAGNRIGGDIGNSQSFLESFVKITLRQYMNEHLVYNPTLIKKKIEEANEMEHQRFIDYLDKLTPAEKKIEMTKKKLGIGMWAIGGTKATFQYDPDHWERNREAVASDYEKAAAYDPNMQLPAAMQLMNTTGYADEGAMTSHDEGYEYSFVADDD